MSNNDQGSPNKKVRKPAANAPKPGSQAKGIPRKVSKKREEKEVKALPPGGEQPPVAARPAPTETKELPTENHPLPTEEMEVHHHPDLHHKAKPWKEYLLEGFMIFIAVMMGFIAENIRESITNSQHARELTLQLVQDLKTDTVNLNDIYAAETGIIKKNDMLFNLLQQPMAKIDTRQIQKLIADSHSLFLLNPSEGAIGAIKNELHLKQFSNSEILSYIGRYAFHKGLLLTAQEITLKYQRTYLDPFLTAHFTPVNLKAAFSNGSTPNAQMRNLTQDDLNQLAADMVLIRVNTDELLRHNREAKNDAVNLLQYVNKQYHLGDE
jgi:hypothetical protein